MFVNGIFLLTRILPKLNASFCAVCLTKPACIFFEKQYLFNIFLQTDFKALPCVYPTVNRVEKPNIIRWEFQLFHGLLMLSPCRCELHLCVLKAGWKNYCKKKFLYIMGKQILYSNSFRGCTGHFQCISVPFKFDSIPIFNIHLIWSRERLIQISKENIFIFYVGARVCPPLWLTNSDIRLLFAQLEWCGTKVTYKSAVVGAINHIGPGINHCVEDIFCHCCPLTITLHKKHPPPPHPHNTHTDRHTHAHILLFFHLSIGYKRNHRLVSREWKNVHFSSHFKCRLKFIELYACKTPKILFPDMILIFSSSGLYPTVPLFQ